MWFPTLPETRQLHQTDANHEFCFGRLPATEAISLKGGRVICGLLSLFPLFCLKRREDQ